MPDLGYRSAGEIENWKNNRDPITSFIESTTSLNILTSQDVDEIRTTVESDISEAIRFADESPEPESIDIYEDLYG